MSVNVHLINYDLNSPGQNYDRLIRHIKSYSDWCPMLASCWAVSTSKSVSTVRDECNDHVDSGDDLLVVDISTTSWASWGLPEGATNWLKQHRS